MSTSERRESHPALRMLVWLILAVAGCALWVVSLGADGARAWRALLINFLFFSSLSGGLVVWPAVVGTCQGRWQRGVEKVAAAGIAFAIPSLVALVLLWIGSARWAPWYGQTYSQGPWLNNDFLFGRDLVALLVFWGVAVFYLMKRRSEVTVFWGAILVLVYSLVFSLLGFDLVMALDPHWHSNLAGGYFFISGLYIAITGWGLLAAWHPGSDPDQRHDIGTLIVAFSLMTTYLMFAHLLLMWYENLPHEVRYLIARMHYPGWQAVSYFLVGLVYFGPLVLLLGEKTKANRISLGIITALVLFGTWIERWWLVAPSFDTQVRLGLSELSLAAGCLGILGLGMEQLYRRLPELYLPEESEQ